MSAVDRLEIHVGEPAVHVSPDLWGLFLEDINYSLDGGLNAQLVRNGDFEFSTIEQAEWGPLTGWQIDGAGTVRVHAEAPIHPNNRHYVRVTGPLTLSNEGWGGVLVEPGQALRLRGATWLLHGRGDLRALVVDADGRTLASADLAAAERGWSWSEADLVPHVDAPQRGTFRLEVPHGTIVELDAITLRPLEADGRVRSFRPDLVAALRDLSPSFVRFPGGCVAHGIGLENVYHWKGSIGPEHTRRPLANIWGYHQSRQIGYLEYFELCELIGATPLPVVAAGVCCQNLRGGAQPIAPEDMPAYIQDVLDLVEFANGDVQTRWGARRAELGHPEPFGMRYLGLGNEDEITDDFRDRYAQIEDALRARHPEVVVIGTAGPFPDGPDFDAGWEFARARGTAVVDEHSYRNPRWYFQNVDRYDDYPRSGGEVYFGEYAARTSTVRSALAEAAFMIGMERNGDVVRLASYAPLLARVGDTQWVPDLIYFDDDAVLPSASYHVQAMFAAERGTRSHALEVVGDGREAAVGVPTAGSVRFRSPGAQVRLSGSVDGVELAPLTTEPEGQERVLAAIDPTAAAVELCVRRLTGSAGAVVSLGGDCGASRIDVELGSWANHATVCSRIDDGVGHNEDGPYPWHGLETDRETLVRIELTGPRVRVWVDGELRHDYAQDLRPEQRIVAGAFSRPAPDGGLEHVVRLVNATPDEREVTVSGGSWRSGTATVLAGAEPEAGAPFETSPVTPQGLAVEVTSAGAALTLPRWSFAVAILHGEEAATPS